jgi:hypothetical protein
VFDLAGLFGNKLKAENKWHIQDYMLFCLHIGTCGFRGQGAEKPFRCLKTSYFDLGEDCMYDLTYYLYHSNKESNNLYIT